MSIQIENISVEQAGRSFGMILLALVSISVIGGIIAYAMSIAAKQKNKKLAMAKAEREKKLKEILQKTIVKTGTARPVTE